MPKSIKTNMDPAIIYIAPTNIDHLDSLPNGIVATPARIKNRYGNNYNLKLRVPKKYANEQQFRNSQTHVCNNPQRRNKSNK